MSRDSGQASVELVALLPLVAVLGVALWQTALFGQAVWAGSAAARAGARAEAVGEDASRAALSALPSRLRDGARVRTAEDGAVEVRITTPLWTITHHARFESQR